MTIKLVILAAWAVTVLSLAVPASAQIGDVIDCRPSDGSSNHSEGFGSGEFLAQTFLATESGLVSAVKVPVTRISGSNTFDVFLYPTADVSGTQRPDLSGAPLASLLNVGMTTLPNSAGTFADQALACNTTDKPGQVFEFTTPVFVSSGTTYAIVIDPNTGGEWNAELTAIIGDVYPAGHFDSCNSAAPLFRNCADPADWAIEGATGDESAFAVFGIVVTPPAERTIDTWIVNLLNAMGMNSPMGRLLIGVGFAVVVLIALLLVNVPFLFAAAFGSIVGTVLVTALLVSEAAFMALVAIVGIGLIGKLVMGGGSSDG